MKNIYVYLIDSLADWEIGFLTAELKSRRYFKKNIKEINLVTVSCNKRQITSMGGMKIESDIFIDELKQRMINEDSKDDMLILPGSDYWLSQNNKEILDVAHEWFNSGRNLAAICGATIALASIGILDNIKHTSNDKGFLMQISPSYKGESFYQNELSVSDKNLITASGIGPIDFAYNIIEKLDIFTDKTLLAWFNLNKTGNPKYFYDLMKSLEN